MSGRLMEWAIQITVPMSHAAMRVLMVLTKHANDDGSDCFPSMETIQKTTQSTRGTVVRCLAQLAHLGLITPERRKGRRGNIYRFNFGAWKTTKPSGPTPPPAADLFGETVAPSDHSQRRGKGRMVRPIGAVNSPIVNAESPTIGPDSINTPSTSTLSPSVRAAPPPLRVVAGTALAVLPVADQAVAKAKRKPDRHRLPDDWRPSPDDRRYATDLGHDPDRILLDFRAHFLEGPGCDTRWKNWSAAWQGWVRRQRHPAAPSHRTSANDVRAQTRATFASLGLGGSLDDVRQIFDPDLGLGSIKDQKAIRS